MHDSPASPLEDGLARPAGVSPADEAAESWVRRLQAGLSIEEEVEFAEWLAADARHEPSLRRYQAAWDRFAPLAGTAAAVATPDRARAGSRAALLRWSVPAVGLAAALVLLLTFFPRPRAPRVDEAFALPALCEQRTLADGSVVELNRGAEISVTFTAAERRVQLQRGEAGFTVVPEPGRPFVVAVGAIEVRAVGTAFNVRFVPEAVEVVVTHGKVYIDESPPRHSDAAARAPHAAPARGAAPAAGALLTASQSARVDLVPAEPPLVQVTTLTPDEIESRLAWRPKRLDFDDAPLSAIVAEFNQRNPVRLVVPDPVVAGRRMTATFRSDNLEAFVRLIEANIGVRAERRSATEIALVPQ